LPSLTNHEILLKTLSSCSLFFGFILFSCWPVANMITHVLVALSLLGLTVAQSTVALFLPGFDSQPLQATIVTAGPSATTYVVACSPGTDATQCGVPSGITVVQGASMYQLSQAFADFTVVIDCSLGGTTGAVCSQYGKSPSTDVSLASSVITYSASQITFLPVAITTGTLSTMLPTTSTMTPTLPSAPSTGAILTSCTSAMSPPAPKSTGGVPQVTGNAHWALGGAAVALALAAV